MLEIDGSEYSGSGTIVRQAVGFSALTGKAIHVVNARARRTKPGLRRQHIRVVEAICQLVNGSADGLYEGSQEFTFQPGSKGKQHEYCWDIGSAGSTTMLALAVLPVLAFMDQPTAVEIRGGLFQDFAPSMFHLQKVMLPYLRQMGLEADVQMSRPGYVPTGEGQLHMMVRPAKMVLQPLVKENRGPIESLWGIALASNLAERHVGLRMAEAAKASFANAGYQVQIETREDSSAKQPGAALAAFADCDGGVRLGADRAGAPGRPSESIGRYVARQLLNDLATGATLDHFAADQIIPFASIAQGESRFVIPKVTDHIETSAWLARTFIGAQVKVDRNILSIKGIGFGLKRS